MNAVDEPSPEERLWKPTEAARYLGVSRSWVYQHALDGDLPSLRFAGCLRFEPAKIRAYARGELVGHKADVLPLKAVK